MPSQILSTRGNTGLLRRLMVTLSVIVLYRIGSQIPTPSVDPDLYRSLLERRSSGSGSNLLIDLTGSTVLTLFGLAVVPMLTASLVLGLSGKFIPKVAELRSGGPAGLLRYSILTRRVAFVMAVITAYISTHVRMPIEEMVEGSPSRIVMGGVLGSLVHVASITVGFLLLLALAEWNNRHGLGNGVMVITVAMVIGNAAPRLAQLISSTATEIVAYLVALILSVTLLTIIISAKRVVPLYSVLPQVDPNLPAGFHVAKLAAGSAGPVLFASASLSSLTMLTSIPGVPEIIRSSVDAVVLGSSVPAMLVNGLMIIVFARVYASIANDPVEMANETARSGRFLRGLPPGVETARHFYGLSAGMGWAYAFALVPVLLTPIVLAMIIEAPSVLLGGNLLIPVIVLVDMIQTGRATATRQA